MAVYLLEAYYDENHKTGYEGTKPGDQIQKSAEGERDSIGEVRQSDWRNMKATMLCRYKDRDMAKKHAEAAKFFVNSKHVGYSQPNRLSLKNYIKSIGYKNYKKLDKDKEVDCSSLMCLCCNLAGVSAVGDWNTTEMLKQMPKLTKYFDIYTSDKDPKYFNSPDYLIEGDILIRDGHTAGVYGNGSKVGPTPEPVKPESNDPAIAGKYEATTAVNMRYGPSSSEYDIIRVVEEKEVVTCDGSYTNDWYYVTTTSNESGYIKKDYLKLVEQINPTPEPEPNNQDKDGNGKIDELASPKSKNSALEGSYVATTDVNMRYGPSSSEYDIIRVVKRGEVVRNYGYYTGNWLYVKDSKGNKGYISKSYLKKK